MFSISLIFVDQKTIWELNKKYRGVDKPTTVLSFYYGSAPVAGKGAGFLIPEGEVFICPQEAKKQNVEIGDLVKHGVQNILSEIPTAEISRIGFTRNKSRVAKNC